MHASMLRGSQGTGNTQSARVLNSLCQGQVSWRSPSLQGWRPHAGWLPRHTRTDVQTLQTLNMSMAGKLSLQTLQTLNMSMAGKLSLQTLQTLNMSMAGKLSLALRRAHLGVRAHGGRHEPAIRRKHGVVRAGRLLPHAALAHAAHVLIHRLLGLACQICISHTLNRMRNRSGGYFLSGTHAAHVLVHSLLGLGRQIGSCIFWDCVRIETRA